MTDKSHRVLLMTTGGTIAGEVAHDRQDEAIKGTPDDFLRIIAPTIDYLSRRRKLDIGLDTHEVANVDSSDIQPAIWTELANTIRDKYEDYEAFIITHGTNTLGYTCAALSFALVNPAKPIILTGSQVAAGLPGSDGAANLENALRVATWERPGTTIRGVLAVFGSHIISGTRVKKDTEFDYDAFKSFSTSSVGRIGRIININPTNLEKHVNYLSTKRWPEATDVKALRCESDFDMRIASLTEFPGMASEIFESLVDNNDIQGIVLRAFGAGDPCTKHQAAFKELKRREIPLVITTQAPNGNSNFQVNEPGEFLREHDLAIPAYDMSIEAMTTKLGWLLAKKAKGKLSYDMVSEEMQNDLKGEINVLWEVGV